MTIMLSFIIFPKQFSWYYVAGSCLVLGGLTYSGLDKKGKGRGMKKAKVRGVAKTKKCKVMLRRCKRKMQD